MLFFRDQLHPPRDRELGFEFQMRTSGMSQELLPLSSSKTAVPFGDVRCNRNNGAPHLRCEPKHLPLWKCLSKFVDEAGEHNRLLPGDEVTIVTGHTIAVLREADADERRCARG